MKLKMLETRRGSEDAFSVKLFEEGKTYEVADSLARSFIAKGWATEIVEEPVTASEMLYQALKPPTREELERALRSLNGGKP